MLRAGMVALAAAALAAYSPSARAAETAAGQQQLVDRATLAVQDLLSPETGQQAASVLRDARAVVVCPSVLRAGFLLGGEGGGCVLLARDAAGSWSAPAFYSMGAASIGFQVGLQDAEIIMIIRTARGLQAVIDDQFKVGANASVAVVNFGGGIDASMAPALNADIIAFAKTRGLFAGISLQGSMLGSDSAGNAVYYGQPVGSIDIVMQMRVNNPGADPLRAALMQLGGSGGANAPAPVTATAAPASAYAPPPSYSQARSYAPRSAGPAPLNPGPVQQQTLAPP